MFRPRLIVCLGVPAALGRWRPWPGYAALDQRGGQSVDDCSVAGVTFVAVAVRHPSAVLAWAEWDGDAALLARAAGSLGPL